MHEDLNRIKVKPITEGIESKNRPNEEVARESWINYLKRNQSIVTETFAG